MTLRIAHRGASGYAPENTILAFKKALDLGCEGIEIDVRATSDGKAVVMHDEQLDRTTFGRGLVKHHTLAQLQQIRNKNANECIPSLLETLQTINGACHLNIEIKEPEAVADVLLSIKESAGWKPGQIWISAFNWEILLDIKNQFPNLNLGVLTESNLPKAIEFAKKHNLFAVHPYHGLLNKHRCAALQSAGIRIFAWTVNDKAIINEMLHLGVDGIISDFPDKI
jgi:glycerophosphoryl diester phosphodiesterase